MKKSKQAKTSEGVDEVDRVSDLPDPILHLILSGLPTTEEVIRSSVLSRRWRNLWTSIPRIDVDYSRVGNPEQASERNKFTEFVDRVLLNSSLDLDSFRLSCEDCCSMSTVGRWIHAAVTRNVKQLHLQFRPMKESRDEYEIEHQDIEMPHCLVTCCSLEVLRLFLLKGYLSLPKYTGFPSLRVLELNGVGLFDADIIKAFFTSCPVLEDLTLIDCETVGLLCISSLTLKNLRIDNREMDFLEEYFVCDDLEISCPKLVFLELTGPIAYNFFFDSLDSLKKAVIQPDVLFPGGTDDTVCELFTKISHVESLSVSHEFLVECIGPEVDVPVSLPNLKTLELTLDYSAVYQALEFLKCLPHLDSLHLNIISDYSMENFWKLNEATTMRIWSRQLKRVVFGEFSGEKWELEIACFFLEHGKALEEMVFSWEDEDKFNESSKETMNEVSKFHKASQTFKLIALLKPWTVPTTFEVQRD